MSKIERIHFAKMVRPMKTTFATSLGSKNCATSVIVKVICSNDAIGIGEVPTSFVFKHETVDAIKNILTQARQQVIGCSINDYPSFISKFRKEWPQFHMTISGLEVAMFRAWLKFQGISEYCHWGAKSKKIETDITIPFVPQKDMLNNWLNKAIKAGFSIYKIKVSGDVDRDIKFIEVIHKKLRDSIKNFTIRLDGNQGYTAATCLNILGKLEKKNIAVELFEQPLLRDDYSGFKKLYSRSRIPIIADETVLTPDDCKRVIEGRLAHGVNIKIAKSGIADSCKILRLAKKAGLKLMIGCMTETMVGLSAAIFLAAGSKAFDYIDLDSIHFLRHRNSYDGLTITGRYYNIMK